MFQWSTIIPGPPRPLRAADPTGAQLRKLHASSEKLKTPCYSSTGKLQIHMFMVVGVGVGVGLGLVVVEGVGGWMKLLVFWETCSSVLLNIFSCADIETHLKPGSRFICYLTCTSAGPCFPGTNPPALAQQAPPPSRAVSACSGSVLRWLRGLTLTLTPPVVSSTDPHGHASAPPVLPADGGGCSRGSSLETR